MAISSIHGAAAYAANSVGGAGTPVATAAAAQASATTAQRPRRAEEGGQQPQSGGQLMQSIALALGQMGIAYNGQPKEGAAQTPPEAMHRLMHDVFEAMQQQEASTNSSMLTSQGFSADLQSLIASLGSGSAKGGTPGGAKLDRLQSDFDAFLASLPAGQARQASGSSADRQSVMTFLQNLQANLGGGNMPKVGGLVGTTS